MQIDLLGGSYKAKYQELNSQRTINWYQTFSNQLEKNKSQTALYPTPGLTLFTQLPGRNIRALYTAIGPLQTRCFAICDTTLYEILPNQSYTPISLLPELANGASKVYMTINDNSELGIWHSSASYVYNTLTTILQPVTNNQFPGTVTYADYLDTYTVVISNGAVWESATGSSLNWIGTQTYTTTFTAGPVIAAATLRESIYNFTAQTIETFINDGVSPYSRLPRSTVNVGLIAKESLVKYKDGFLFLGKDYSGECAVFFFDGWYNCAQISPASISWQLNSLSQPPYDASGYIQYTKDGQIFYYLTVPELKTTFVYDVATKDWHERQSANPVPDSNGDIKYNEFRGKHYTNFSGKHLFADKYSGAIFIEDFTNFTENGTTIKRTRISKTFSESYQLITVASLELDCDVGMGNLSGQGVNPTLQVFASHNGGNTFVQPRQMFLGTEGKYKFRARLMNLGSSRNWVIKLELTDPINLMIQNAIVNGSTSAW